MKEIYGFSMGVIGKAPNDDSILEGALERREKTENLIESETEMEGMVKMQDQVLKKVGNFRCQGSTWKSKGGAGKETIKWSQAGWEGWRKISVAL